MNVRISRQHWDGLLAELDQARRQRHLLTYRALLERLQLPSPAMLTLTAALEHLAAMDAKAPGIVGAITGRAIYEGTLDVAEAQAFCDSYKA